MSAGVLRKQYEALEAFADSLGVSYTTPTGSFNEKFCELCRVIIDDLGGTFTPIASGSFSSRKADYLRQVAVAVGITTTEAGSSFRETFLKSARLIWTDSNDGTAPDTGASLDWRVYQYLNHAIGGPGGLDPLQWLYTPSSPSTVLDKTVNALDADYVESNCVVTDGVADELLCANSSLSFGFGTDDFCWEFYGIVESGYDYLFGNVASGTIRTGSGFLMYSVPGIANYPSSLAIPYGEIAYYKVCRTGSSVQFMINANSDTVTGVGANSIVNFRHALFSRNGSQFSAGTGIWCKLDSAFPEVNFHYVFSGGIGMGTSEPDVSENGNDGVWNVGPGGTATLRSGLQDVFHRNIFSGYSIWEHASDPDILVSYGDDGLPLPFAKTGYTKTADYPPVTGNKIHNACETKIKQKSANTELLDNPFWSADGVNYEAKSFADMRTHLNYDHNVVICSDDSAIYAAWTWLQSYGWTPSAYLRMNAYLSGQGCTGSSLIPYPVTSGTGIGPDSDWYTYDGTNIYFVEDA